MSDRFIVTSDTRLSSLDQDQIQEGVQRWLTTSDRPVAVFTVGLHVWWLHDGLATRVCHHEAETVPVQATAE